MEKISLKRTGSAKLEFNGEILAEANSKHHHGPCENRWFELAVYRREGGYVGSIGFRTIWQGEMDQDFATPLEDTQAVRRYFETFDSCNPSLWRGIPENVHDAARRNSYYRDAISTAFRTAVSELLTSDEFVEKLN